MYTDTPAIADRRRSQPGKLSHGALLHQSDERLVALARSGSERAWAEITRRYGRQLRAYCARFVGASRAEDAVQQTFLQAFLALRDGTPREIALRAWLYRIAHNCSIDLLRKGTPDYDQLDLEYDGVAQPPTLFEQREEVRRLVARMRALPDAQRQALALRELEGRSYEEISARLGHSGSGVRQLIFRARTALRNSAAAHPAARVPEEQAVPAHAARVSSRGDRRIRAGVVRGRNRCRRCSHACRRRRARRRLCVRRRRLPAGEARAGSACRRLAVALDQLRRRAGGRAADFGARPGPRRGGAGPRHPCIRTRSGARCARAARGGCAGRRAGSAARDPPAGHAGTGPRFGYAVGAGANGRRPAPAAGDGRCRHAGLGARCESDVHDVSGFGERGCELTGDHDRSTDDEQARRAQERARAGQAAKGGAAGGRSEGPGSEGPGSEGPRSEGRGSQGPGAQEQSAEDVRAKEACAQDGAGQVPGAQDAAFRGPERAPVTHARRPRKCVLLAAGAVALTIAPASPPIAAAAEVCAQKTPTALQFKRKAGKRHGRLSWHASRGANRRFRVFRNGAVVGQTLRRSMRVAVKPGRQYVFTVRPVNSAGSVSNCAGELTQALRWYPPFRVRHVAVKRVAKLRATISWGKVRRGDGKLAGYRVYRDGVVYRQVKPWRRSVPVRVTPGLHKFLVIAADTRGAMGMPSRTVRVRVRHSPPSIPGRLRIGRVSDTTVELGWGNARKRSSPIAGYRILRNGVPVGQVRGLSATIGNLAPVTGYRFAIAAVDRWGYTGQSTIAQTTTAMPPPTTGKLHAFLLASTDESFIDLQRHYRQIGTVYPTYFDCRRGNGAIIGKDDPLVTRWAQLRKIVVMPRFNCQHGPTLNMMLRNSALRETTLTNLVGLVQTHGYDGINLDFEAGFDTDRDVLTSFVAELGRRLHALGKRLAVEVSAKFYGTQPGRSAFYDYPNLGRHADTVFVMAWGWHWTTSDPGPSDELANVLKVANYVATMPNKHRYVLGLPLYAHDWPWSGGPSNPSVPREYGEIMETAQRHGVTPRFDANAYSWTFNYVEGGVPHEVWFGDVTTVSRRIKVAQVRGLGLGLLATGPRGPANLGRPPDRSRHRLAVAAARVRRKPGAAPRPRCGRGDSSRIRLSRCVVVTAESRWAA